MKKLSAILTMFYFSMLSVVNAAETTTIEQIEHELAEGIHAAEHSEKGGLPQFEPESFVSQFFWLALSFVVLYFIFSKITLPNISNVIENRKNIIESDLEMAEKLTAEADEVHDAYNANLMKSSAAATAALAKTEEKNKAKQDKKSEEFRVKSEAAIAETEARIIEAKENAMQDMNKVITDVAVNAIEKIIGTKADPKKVKSIVENIDVANKPMKKTKTKAA